MDFEERYRVIHSRDARFDGQFITAVRSTGIYCRPSCPARTPKAANVTFYETSAAAHEAGYRACKRCLPEAVPGTPAWNLRDDTAARAMRLIGDGVVEREGVGGLAARLGYSTRHLTRVLTHELGAGPLALARAHRAQTARTLLTSTDLPISDIAFAAGFSSVRQFNDTVGEVFQLTPTQVRERPTRHAASAPGAIDLVLPYREPFDASGVFAWLAARAIPGIEQVTTDARGHHAYTRSVLLPAGPAWFTVRHTPPSTGAGRLTLEAHLTNLGDLPVLVARVRRLFDLDADPVAIDAALSAEPSGATPAADAALTVNADDGAAGRAALAARVRALPGIRMPGAVDPHEMLFRAIIGQQITVASARTLLHRLAVAAGSRLPFATSTDDSGGGGGESALAGTSGGVASGGAADGDGGGVLGANGGVRGESAADGTSGGGESGGGEQGAGSGGSDGPFIPTLLFPTPAQIAEHAAAVLTGPRAKISTVVAVAEALAAGELELSFGDDATELHRRLTALPGIGDWTAGYLAMRVLGAPDVLLTGDVAIRTGARTLGIPDAPRALTEWSTSFAPWRSYLCLHLWRAAADAPPPPRRPSPSRASPAASPTASNTTRSMIKEKP